MPRLMIRHKVKDYEHYLREYERFMTLRQRYGCTFSRIFRDLDDDKMVIAYLEFESKEAADAYLESEEVALLRPEAGVIEPVDSVFLEADA